MNKNKLTGIIFLASTLLTACATSQSYVAPTQNVLTKATYFTAAITEWVAEELPKGTTIIVAANQNGKSLEPFNKELISAFTAKGFIIAKPDETNKSLPHIEYSITEYDTNLLLIIKANGREATRLFAPGANNTIIPISPISIRDVIIKEDN